MEKRICSKCNWELPLTREYFLCNPRAKGGFQKQCKMCAQIIKLAYRKRNQDRLRARERELRVPYKTYIAMVYTYYKIREDDLRNLLDSQKGCCAICGKSLVFPEWSKSHMHIDHDHDTGKVRGLLCGKCNWLIGLSEENHNILENAMLYLGKTKL